MEVFFRFVPIARHRYDVHFNAARYETLSTVPQVASRKGNESHRMDRLSGRQKLTRCRPRQWSVTPPKDRQLDRPPPTVGGQSSDNWQTLSRARGESRPEAERRTVLLLYDLLIAAAILTDRKYEFITDHVTVAMTARAVISIMKRLHYPPARSSSCLPS